MTQAEFDCESHVFNELQDTDRHTHTHVLTNVRQHKHTNMPRVGRSLTQREVHDWETTERTPAGQTYSVCPFEHTTYVTTMHDARIAEGIVRFRLMLEIGVCAFVSVAVFSTYLGRRQVRE